MFVYTTTTEIFGYFIRKESWHRLLNDHADIAGPLRRSVIIDYFQNIRSKVMPKKRDAIASIGNRHDQQIVLVSEFKSKAMFKKVLSNVFGLDGDENEESTAAMFEKCAHDHQERLDKYTLQTQ